LRARHRIQFIGILRRLRADGLELQDELGIFAFLGAATDFGVPSR
jgi:hypothetical protein